jgi:hypothetical protein
MAEMIDISLSGVSFAYIADSETPKGFFVLESYVVLTVLISIICNLEQLWIFSISHR